MSWTNDLIERVQGALSGLTERERKLLAIMLIIVVLLGGFFFFNSMRIKSAEYRDGITARRDAIDQLLANRDEYAAQIAAQRRTQEQLRNNDLSLATFVETQARNLRITRPSNFSDSRQPVAGNEAVTALSTEVVFPSMSLQQLSDFADAIARSRELVYVQRIELEQPRNASAFQVTMKLATYRMSEGGE